MAKFYYELFLAKPCLTVTDWEEILAYLIRYVGFRGGWRLLVELKHQTIHYYLEVPLILPPHPALQSVIFRPTAEISLPPSHNKNLPVLMRPVSNLQHLITQLLRRNLKFIALEIDFSFAYCYQLNRIHLLYRQNQRLLRTPLLPLHPATLLSSDFSSPASFLYRKVPQTLKTDRISPFLSSSSPSALLELTENFDATSNFFGLADFDFAKHSLVLGSSGSGKSKFIAKFIEQIYQIAPHDYRVVVFDPHDQLKHDLTNITSQQVFSFTSPADSVELFSTGSNHLAADVELFLGLFASLMGERFNNRCERVLRFGLYLLAIANELSFLNLRTLLLDSEYRSALCHKHQTYIPSHLQQFFLTEYSQVKSQFYDQAIAPIISFLDEMQMLPAFRISKPHHRFDLALQQNFLTTFSFNLSELGLKPTKTIAGFLMQQIFQLATRQTLTQHLVVVIDEVSVLENPILVRFLSELRKYRVSVILIGQYFSQISQNLQSAILANTVNYFIFRVAKSDATIFSHNLDFSFKISKPTSDLQNDAVKLLTKLNTRECLAAIERQGKKYPVFKAHTLDHSSPPYKEPPKDILPTDNLNDSKLELDFSIQSSFNIEQLMRINSTSRKYHKEQNEH